MGSLSSVLKQRRKELGLTLAQVADMVGVAEATVQRWESGNIKTVRYDKIGKLSEALRVRPEALMDWEWKEPSSQTNIFPYVQSGKVPLIGSIACGTPILAEENVADYIDLPGHIRADYALICKGDSMINAGIQDGDVVYIRKQLEVENGQIAAVLVDSEEATLKRFYRVNEKVTLNAENPIYPPMVFVGEEISKLKVIGLAVAFTHEIV